MAKETEGQEESRDTPILIKTYGEFWNPELVNWDNSWRLLGKRRADFRGPDVDVYEERGVYVLYKDYQAVYVGKADKQSIGYRLQLHRQSWRRCDLLFARRLAQRNGICRGTRSPNPAVFFARDELSWPIRLAGVAKDEWVIHFTVVRLTIVF